MVGGVEGAQAADLNVADEAELAGDEAEEDDVEVDEQVDQEDQEEDGGLWLG